RGRDVGGARRVPGHALARQRTEAPAPLEVVLHHLGDIQTAVSRRRGRERHDRDRHRIAHPGGDLDLQRGVRRACQARDEQKSGEHGGGLPHAVPDARTAAVVGLQHIGQSGLNLIIKLRSNNEGSGGAGSGEARYTAAWMDSRTAWSPLHSPMLTSVTSPPGTCVTFNMQSMPALAVGGRSQARVILAAIAACQLASAPLLRTESACSSAARLRCRSASAALRSAAAACAARCAAAFSSAAFATSALCAAALSAAAFSAACSAACCSCC